MRGGQGLVTGLVVEDEEDIKLLLVEELEDRGYEVRKAGNGVIAMQRISEQIPDIIFADVMMPVMDGFDLISKLREDSKTSGIPMVLVTGMNTRNAERIAKYLGVKHHLTKSWEAWALDDVLEQAHKARGHGPKEGAKYQVYLPKMTGRGKTVGHPPE